MRDKLLFSYNIEYVKVNVYYCDFHKKVPFINKEFYNGVAMAIADYLFYPYEVITPRIHLFSVDFEYDKALLDDIILIGEEYIAECTKDAFLNFMEESIDNAEKILPEHVTSPDLNVANINFWCDKIKRKAEETKVSAYILESKTNELMWVKFIYENNMFYGRYRDKSNDTLLVSLPGYNSEWNDLSAYMDGEYDILQLAPLGYNTPQGFNEKKRVRGAWPVLYDTVSGITEDSGYNQWFFEVCLAIKVVKKPKQKLLFLGTSQGGGAALILSSIYNDHTIACASEMPFLIGFSDKNYKKVKDFVGSRIGYTGEMIYDFWAKERLHRIDPCNHVNRIKCGTYLLAGRHDNECPKEDIFELYNMLKCQKKFVEIEDRGHGYTDEFKSDAYYWFAQMIKENEEDIDYE